MVTLNLEVSPRHSPDLLVSTLCLHTLSLFESGGDVLSLPPIGEEFLTNQRPLLPLLESMNLRTALIQSGVCSCSIAISELNLRPCTSFTEHAVLICIPHNNLAVRRTLDHSDTLIHPFPETIITSNGLCILCFKCGNRLAFMCFSVFPFRKIAPAVSPQ